MSINRFKKQLGPKVVFLVQNNTPSMVGAGFFNSKHKNDNQFLRNSHAYQEAINLVVSRVCMGAWSFYNRATRKSRRRRAIRRKWR